MDNKITFLQMYTYHFYKIFASIIIFSAITSCVPVHNFTERNSPIWTGEYGSSNILEDKNNYLLVSYNIKFAEKIEEALKAFKLVDELKNADLILLQEMDTIGTINIAKEMQMNYIYIPAANHGKNSDYFGNSILSKWPILKFEKIILPHLASNGRQRIGLYSLVDINGNNVHIYNIHLATMTMKRKKRVDQLRTVLEHSKSISKDEAIIVAGDFNSFFPKDRKLFSELMSQYGFNWDSKNLKYTAKALKGLIRPHIDQVFSKGLTIRDIGVATQVKASDHFPIYVDLHIKE